ncbi:uncharacterized protein LOC132757049 [Ruditapes philippinarum]|uniref:uncharacterized protein LOC132757049 n=1 Tax=Ruditapes philippinarum TaxID=129788 RepID=UPI00295ACF3A|nr:uncharacterized protein LOC132757049 [Ruditapes philippinarum]XP_060604212.1 uncharacterized protein LOC132757049 [Ruditapes philippinarum]
MKCRHIIILQLCFIFVLCAKLSRKQLEQRLQAMQTLIFQDAQIMKEGIRNNAEGIKTLADSMKKHFDSLQETLSIPRNTKTPNAKRPIGELQYDPKPQINQSDIKRLQQAFKELKMHSLALQVNTFNQLEIALIEKQELFMKNISIYLANMVSKSNTELSETLISNLQKFASCTEKVQGGITEPPLAAYSQIIKKVESVLEEVIKGQSMISDRLSSLNTHQTNSENKIAASCFNVVYAQKPDFEGVHDHKCYNISAQPRKKVTFHCNNKNIRLGDAIITDVAVEGRIEVRYNNHWGTVCDDGFDEQDAITACRSAGFARGVVENRVPAGSGQIWLSYLGCNGEEFDIFDCSRNHGIGHHQCSHSEDAGVRCFWLP